MSAHRHPVPQPLPGRALAADPGHGQPVAIRPIAPEDADAEREFLERLSEEARRGRFLGQFRSPGDALLARLTRIDPLTEAAYAAVAREDGQDRIVGVARFAAHPGRAEAECAVVVRDDWQGEGLGVALMQVLVQEARNRRLRRLYSMDASDNADMAELARHLGFTRRADPGDPALVIHELEL